MTRTRLAGSIKPAYTTHKSQVKVRPKPQAQPLISRKYYEKPKLRSQEASPIDLKGLGFVEDELG